MRQSYLPRQDAVAAGLRGASVLTVSDVDGFIDAGGMIQFISEDNHIRFLINVEAPVHARLKLSSKLLSLARVPGKSANGVGN